MRKYLSHAFSDRSLKEQEHLVSEVVDEFVNQIGKEGAPSGKGIDLVTWFNLTTFDIITSLAFGEAFGGYIESVIFIFDHVLTFEKRINGQNTFLDFHCHQQSRSRSSC